MSYVLCLTSYVLRLMSYVLCQKDSCEYQRDCLRFSRVLSLYACALSDVGCLSRKAIYQQLISTWYIILASITVRTVPPHLLLKLSHV